MVVRQSETAVGATMDRQGDLGAIRGFVKWVVITVLALNIVVLPVIYYRGYHPDIYTVTRFGKGFLEGRDLYEDGNPYLPSSMLLWAPFSLVDRPIAWLTWKLLAALCAISALTVIHNFVAKRTGQLVAWLCLLNLGVLAGFTPKSGNPGNIAAPLSVLAAFLAMEGRDRLGGVILGLALSLKYPLGIPVLGFALLARKLRFVLSALVVFLLLNVVALCWFAVHGHDISKIPASIVAGVKHVGGYEAEGFATWFSKDVRGKYSTLSSAALFHTAGIPEEFVQPLSLTLLAIVGVLSMVSVWKNSTHLLLSLAIFCPAFLTLTYHRYYDSALVAFPIVVAWHVIRNSRFSRSDRIIAGLALGLSLFLARSLAYTITNRLNASASFLQSPLYNFVLGPIHLYAIYTLSVACIYWYLRYGQQNLLPSVASPHDTVQ